MHGDDGGALEGVFAALNALLSAAILLLDRLTAFVRAFGAGSAGSAG